MTNQEKAKALVVASIVTVGKLGVVGMDDAIEQTGLEGVILGMLDHCEELTSWVKNTSYQWHKAQSFVLHGFMKKTKKVVSEEMELYVTPATQTLKLFNTKANMSIKACPESSRVFKVLPSIFKLLAQNDAGKEVEKIKRLVLNTKLTEEELVNKVKAIMTLLNY